MDKVFVDQFGMFIFICAVIISTYIVVKFFVGVPL